MEHFWSLEDINLQNVWLTIGSFDGVHRGHQEIVSRLVTKAHANDAKAVVLTFFPHPSVVIRGRNDPFYLTTPEERAHLLGGLGVDAAITHPFNETIANLSARSFLKRLTHHLEIRQLWVGFNFAMGKNREGDVATLRRLGDDFGYKLKQIEPIKVENKVISSSHIRELINDGQVEDAAKYLGRPYRIRGKVEKGDGRGKTIGIPTANLAVWKMQLFPKTGVYACHAFFKGSRWKAVVNIGVRPTFENQSVPPRAEAHILNFDQDIYGEEINLSFVTRLREEKRFSSIDDLVKQIHQDINKARRVLPS